MGFGKFSIIILLLSLLGNLVQPPEALGRKRIVLMPFRGKERIKARHGFLKGLKKRVKVLSFRKYFRIADELGVKPLKPKGIPAICSKLKCRFVVFGKVKRKKRKLYLVVTIYNHKGRILGRRAAFAPKRNLIWQTGFAVGRSSLELFDKQESRAASVTLQEEEEEISSNVPQKEEKSSNLSQNGDSDLETNTGEPTYRTKKPPSPLPSPPVGNAAQSPPAKQDLPDAQKTTAEKDLSAVQDTSSPKDQPDSRAAHLSQEKQTLKPDHVKISPPDSTLRAFDRSSDAFEGASSTRPLNELFEISLGMGFSIRDYEIAGQRSNEGRTQYQSQPFPEITLQGQFFPFAIFRILALSSLGMHASYSRHLLLHSSSKDNPEEALASASWELLLDLNYRFALSKIRFSPEVTVAIGFGFRDFDLADNDRITSLNYRFLRGALGLKIPLFAPYLFLVGQGEFRPLLSVGDVAEQRYGSLDSGYAWSAGFGFEGRIFRGLYYFSFAEHLQFATNYQGDPRRDKDNLHLPAPSSGLDRFWRVGAGLGYAFQR